MPSRPAVPCLVLQTLSHRQSVRSSKSKHPSKILIDIISGSIRGDYALAVGRNICHGSDSVENAEKEIAL